MKFAYILHAIHVTQMRPDPPVVYYCDLCNEEIRVGFEFIHLLKGCEELHGLIKFDEPFLDFYTRCNSKTYYHLLMAVKMDIPVLVHSEHYRRRLLNECKERFNVKHAPIFCIQDSHDYYRQIAGTKYRYKKFIIDDPCVFRYNRNLLDEIKTYNPDEVRDLVLTYLSQCDGG